jgi:hypothetical protein
MEMKQVSTGRNSRARSGHFHRFDSAVSDHGPRQIAPIDQPHDCPVLCADLGGLRINPDYARAMVRDPATRSAEFLAP